MFPFKTSDSWVEEAEDKLCPWVTGLNGIQLPSTLWWAAFFVVEREKSVDVSDWRYCLFVDARPRAPITRHPCCVISIKLWPKESHLYRKNDTFFSSSSSCKHAGKVLWCWQKVRQISPITHVTSYIRGFTCKRSASSLHNNQMAECWQCNWWNFTENRFRLWTCTHPPTEKYHHSFETLRSAPISVFTSAGRRGLTFFGGVKDFFSLSSVILVRRKKKSNAALYQNLTM